MTHLGDSRRHYWLVKGMARATGVDLVDAFEQGRLDNGDWDGMVRACRRCSWADGCEVWQARGERAVSTAPKPCRNRARLALLRLEEELAV